MNGLEIKNVKGGKIRLSGIDWATAACLLEVPSILPESKAGPARERLLPDLSDAEPQLNEDWKQFVVPELEHLFAAAGETFAGDVRPLAETMSTQQARSLTIPANHCDAWLSALNQARLILGAQHQVEESDMDNEGFVDLANTKQQAVLRIHILGYVLQLLVELSSSDK